MRFQQRDIRGAQRTGLKFADQSKGKGAGDMRMQLGKLARHRRVAGLAVALVVFAALGVSVGVAQAGTTSA